MLDGECWTADRRPIDPPPVVQLRVIDKSASRSSSPDGQCVIPFFLFSRIQSDRVMNSFSLPLNPVCFSHSLALSPRARTRIRLAVIASDADADSRQTRHVCPDSSLVCVHRPSPHNRPSCPPAIVTHTHHVPPAPFMIDPRGRNLMGHLTEPYCSCSLALLLLPLSLPLWLDIAI